MPGTEGKFLRKAYNLTKIIGCNTGKSEVLVEGTWLSIVDYASVKGISVSTIRRYIKDDKVKFKLVNGKYFISIPEAIDLSDKMGDSESLKLKLEVERLKLKIQKLSSENDELKMLVNLYEGKSSEKENLPELPMS